MILTNELLKVKRKDIVSDPKFCAAIPAVVIINQPLVIILIPPKKVTNIPNI